MPLVTKSAFSELCGISREAVDKALKSGKITLATDGLRINTKKKENENYIDWCKKTAPIRKEKQLIEQANKKAKESSLNGLSLSELDERKKIADIELKLMTIRIKKIEEARLNGELLPTKLVKQAFEIFSQSFIDEYSNDAESLKILIQTKFKLSADQSAEFHGLLTYHVNTAHKKSIDLAINNIREVEEFSKQNKL